MGSGRWSTDVYDAAARFRAATGASAFAYSDSGAARVHDTLDPLGVPVRESRDSAEHPKSLAIAALYQDHGPDWPGIVEDMLGAPVVLRSHGPTAADKRAVAPTQAMRW
jgi:hypothetical protein